jgi:hypothetical protein
MVPGGRLWVVSRLAIGAFCWLTAGYAFTTSSPFAYQQFIQPRVFPWLGAFSDSHALALWVWLALAMSVVWRDAVRAGPARAPAVGFIAAGLAGTAWNSVSPVLPTLADGPRAAEVGIVALVPLLWLSVIDHVASASFLRRQRIPADERARRAIETRVYFAFAGSAVLVTVMYAVIASMALGAEFEPDLLIGGLALGTGSSLLNHLVVFSGLYVVAAAVGRLAIRSFAAQYFALQAAATALLTVGAVKALGHAIGLTGLLGLVVALVVAASISSTWTGLQLRRLGRNEHALVWGLDVFLGPAVGGRNHSRVLVRLGAVAGLAFALARVSSFLDWDFLLLKSSVIAVWVAALAAVYQGIPGGVTVRARVIGAACLLPLAAQQLIGHGAVAAHALERYAVYNPALRTTDDMLEEQSSSPRFVHFLRAHTGVDDVAPVSIDLVRSPARAPLQPAPHVFLFVIDSLRPDYLEPYNRAVDFTPRFAEFAAENLVFTDAFTRYGGTGLSMAGMWAGSAVPHKQYVLPFHPMNPLEKLLDANGYRKALSLDHITAQLVKPSADTIELERGKPEMQFDFCSALGDIETALRRKEVRQRPLFAHTRSLSLHIWGVRTGRVPEGESYPPGFHPPYATHVRRMDACFGRFIDFLRDGDLYENSLIVVTSDHGELLGEDGRWGHSYHLDPAVVRVPLLVHLPVTAESLPVDRHAITFSTDIVPTIYSVLGYVPERPTGLEGATALGGNEQSWRARRSGTYVLAASYGPVYAVVRANGRKLYIADGLAGGDEAWERRPAGGWSRVDVDFDRRRLDQFEIRQHLDRIARTYRLPETEQ